MGTSPIPNFGLRTPPLGGAVCPDPYWNGGRSLVLQGPTAFLGAHWVLTASVEGQPAVSMVPPDVIPTPPVVEEGSIPFSELDGTVVLAQPPDDAGYTAFADVEET